MFSKSKKDEKVQITKLFLTKRFGFVAAVLVLLSAMSSSVNATVLRVTITNNSPTNGQTLTPLYVAFHGMNFDAFDAGSSASLGIELLAELGQTGTVASERLAVEPNSVGGVIAAPQGFAGAPLIEPGETAYLEFMVNPLEHTFLTFLSMILPSNDTFIGSDDPIQVFIAAGGFLGRQVINVTGNNIYDAGTELLDVNASPFTPGGNGGAGVDENGVVSAGQSLAAFGGIALPNGQALDASLIDFVSNPGGNKSFINAFVCSSTH